MSARAAWERTGTFTSAGAKVLGIRRRLGAVGSGSGSSRSGDGRGAGEGQDATHSAMSAETEEQAFGSAPQGDAVTSNVQSAIKHPDNDGDILGPHPS